MVLNPEPSSAPCALPVPIRDLRDPIGPGGSIQPLPGALLTSGCLASAASPGVHEDASQARRPSVLLERSCPTQALPLSLVTRSFPCPQGEAPIPWRSEETHYRGLCEAEVSIFASHSSLPRVLLWLRKSSPGPCLNTRGMGVWCECGVGGCECRGVARGQFQGGLGKGSTCGL